LRKDHSCKFREKRQYSPACGNERKNMTIKCPDYKTKIVCTIGPASRSERTLEELMRQGMNVARLNFSHGTLEEHTEDILRIRDVAARLNHSCTILADLPGIKIRVGKIHNEPVDLKEGNKITLTTTDIVGSPERISVNYERLAESVSQGSLIYLNDGFIQLLVETIAEKEVLCRVVVGGQLLSHKGMSIPGARMHVDPVTPKDLEFISFGLREGVDAFGISFVEKGEDILKVRQFIRESGGSAYLVAKIERAEALENIDGILETTDAIMIARGDLGVQIPLENLPGVQKRVIHKANLLGCPVITATQMLLSMTDHVRPTRAEVSDVANAILDGTDAVMLSEETAIGSYPVDAVDMMARIAASIERDRQSTESFSGPGDQLKPPEGAEMKDIDYVIFCNIVGLARSLAARYIAVSSVKGDEPRKIAGFKPDCWILAFNKDEKIRRFMDLSYGVLPVAIHEDSERSLKSILRYITENYIIPEQALVVATGDFPEDNVVGERSLKIVRTSEFGDKMRRYGKE